MKRVLILCLAMLAAPHVLAADGRSSQQPDFSKIFLDGMKQGVQHLGNQLAGPKTRKEYVPGRPLKDCLTEQGHNELNENVMRCRDGYYREVPIQ